MTSPRLWNQMHYFLLMIQRFFVKSVHRVMHCSFKQILTRSQGGQISGCWSSTQTSAMFYHWEIWQYQIYTSCLKFNTDKCHVLSLGRLTISDIHILLKFNTDKCHVLSLGRFDNIRYTHPVEVQHRQVPCFITGEIWQYQIYTSCWSSTQTSAMFYHWGDLTIPDIHILLKFNTDKCHVLSLGRFDNIRYTHPVEVQHRQVPCFITGEIWQYQIYTSCWSSTQTSAMFYHWGDLTISDIHIDILYTVRNLSLSSTKKILALL